MAAASTAGTSSKTIAPRGSVPTTKLGTMLRAIGMVTASPIASPDDGENGALVQHHARDAGGRGADGKPDSDLARPPADGVGHDSV